MTFAFLLPTPRYIPKCGEYNGYVGFNDELLPSLQGGADWDGPSLDDHVDIHGGITWDSNTFVFEDEPIRLTEFPENWKECRIIGFDTCHARDNSIIWNKEAVTRETLKLKEQIDKLIKDELSATI